MWVDEFSHGRSRRALERGCGLDGLVLAQDFHGWFQNKIKTKKGEWDSRQIIWMTSNETQKKTGTYVAKKQYTQMQSKNYF